METELCLASVEAGRPVRVIIDRTFVDADGCRWIVDWKSSRHEGGDLEAFLRAFYLQVAMGPRPPAIRPDLVLLLVDTLRRSNPHYLGAR